MARIPKALHDPINTAYPASTCLVAAMLPDGYPQVTIRGSTMVFDDEHLALWERGRGQTNAVIVDGTKLTVFYRNTDPAKAAGLPMAGVARFYGVAAVHKSGPIYDQVWQKLIEPEKGKDPEKKGFAVLIKVERAENLIGKPLE